MKSVTPTKGNLIAMKRTLDLAKSGYELMDRKRNILIREIMGLIDAAAEIQEQIDKVFNQAYASLQIANITLGICDRLAAAAPVDDTLNIRYKAVMGVEIPIVTGEDDPGSLIYGLMDSNSALDEAYVNFLKVKRLTKMLSEVEIGVYRLAYAIKKTQKRANALKNVIIPEYQAHVKFITEALEEKEREEFGRLKVIKARKSM